MYCSSISPMGPALVMQICSHISGEQEAIRVISLKPPAATLLHGAFRGIAVLYQVYQAGGHQMGQVADGSRYPVMLPVIQHQRDCSHSLSHCQQTADIL